MKALVFAAAALSTGYLAGEAMRSPVTLFDFDDNQTSWQVVNDGVMGGRSRGYVEVAANGLRFSGTLVTRGGGFTSVRAAGRFDLRDYDGLELRVRGNGRTFEVGVGDGAGRWGRRVSRRAPFPTSEQWMTVRVPFAALRSTIFGQPVEAPPIDRSRVREISLFIADGIDGPFALEVDWIRAYSLIDGVQP